MATGLGTKPMATLALEVDGERRDGMASGDGAVDATFNAIRSAFPHEVALKLYRGAERHRRAPTPRPG